MQRLATWDQFKAVLDGLVIAKTAHFALHKIGPEKASFIQPGQTWLGAMVPKRWAKRAVTRNTIKRQIYTLGSSLELQGESCAYVVRLRSEFSRKQFVSASSDPLKQAVRAELITLLN